MTSPVAAAEIGSAANLLEFSARVPCRVIRLIECVGEFEMPERSMNQTSTRKDH